MNMSGEAATSDNTNLVMVNNHFGEGRDEPAAAAPPPPLVVTLGEDLDLLLPSQPPTDIQPSQTSPLLVRPPRNRSMNAPVSVCLFADVQPRGPCIIYDKGKHLYHL